MSCFSPRSPTRVTLFGVSCSVGRSSQGLLVSGRSGELNQKIELRRGLAGVYCIVKTFDLCMSVPCFCMCGIWSRKNTCSLPGSSR